MSSAVLACFTALSPDFMKAKAAMAMTTAIATRIPTTMATRFRIFLRREWWRFFFLMRTSSSIVWGASEVASVGVPSEALVASGASGVEVVPLSASSRALSFVSLSSKVLRLSR